MNPTALILISRKLLEVAEAESVSKTGSLPPSVVAGDLSFHTINGYSSAADAAVRRPFKPGTTFDSSMALTVLVLLTALFFMGFFSVYIRCFTAEDPSPTSPSRQRPTPANEKGGLDSAAVNSLPLLAYGKAAKHPMIDDCPICLNEFQDRETVKLIPYCGHVFHPNCIDTWLSSHLTCPLCRSAQLFKRVEDVELGVTQEKNGERSTVNNGETWRDEGSSEVTRTGGSDLANLAVLQRSTSFR